MGHVIDDVEDLEPPVIRHLVMDDAEWSADIRLRFQQTGRPCPYLPLGALALTHAQPFLPVESVDSIDILAFALPQQQDEQSPVAEPSVLFGKVSQPIQEFCLM